MVVTRLQIMGGGNMGEALLRGLVTDGWTTADQLHLVEPLADRRDYLVEAVPGLGCTIDYAHQVQIGLTNEGIEPLHDLARHFHVKQSAESEFEVKIDADNGAIDFQRMMNKLKADGYDGVVTVEYVAAPDVIEAGWDMAEETGKLKKVIDEALAV